MGVIYDEKIEWRIFLITDFEKEEAYLRRMHQKGWRLTHITWDMFYHFEAIEPEEMVYKLHFKDKEHTEVPSYRQFYQDYGWDYVAECNSFSIFRKSSAQSGDKELFSDPASRWDMIEQIFKRRFLVLLATMVVVVGIGLYFDKTDFSLTVAVIDGLFVLYLSYRFYQLRKELKGERI
ncbi:DUF2812 domain-containing protein [Streptococcus cameli]